MKQLVRASVCLLAANFLGIASPVNAKDEINTGFERGDSFVPVWTFTTEEAQREAVAPGNRLRFIIARFWPSRPVAVEAPALSERGEELVPMRAPLMILEGPSMVACEVVRQPGNERLTCLVDADRNGTFESYFRHMAVFEYLFTPISPNPSRVRPLGQALSYTELGEWAEADKLQLTTIARIDTNDLLADSSVKYDFCVERTGLTTIWGGQRSAPECLTIGGKVAVAKLPTVERVFGSLVTIEASGVSEVVLSTRPLVDKSEIRFGAGY